MAKNVDKVEKAFDVVHRRRVEREALTTDHIQRQHRLSFFREGWNSCTINEAELKQQLERCKNVLRFYSGEDHDVQVVKEAEEGGKLVIDDGDLARQVLAEIGE